MGRILLSICAVVVAAGISGAAPQPNTENAGEQRQAQSEPGQGRSAVAAASAESPQQVDDPVLTTPCEDGQDNRSSDLCAQWKAADAARDAALWAMLGTIVAAVGTAGLYWQISLTRKAVEDTGTATLAMQAANVLAQKALLAQTRPWLAIKILSIGSATWRDGEMELPVSFVIQNIAGGIATGVHSMTDVRLAGWTSGPDPYFEKKCEGLKPSSLDGGVVYPGQSDGGEKIILRFTREMIAEAQERQYNYHQGRAPIFPTVNPQIFFGVHYQGIEKTTTYVSASLWEVSVSAGGGHRRSITIGEDVPSSDLRVRYALGGTRNS